jgi:hypothetical protein
MTTDTEVKTKKAKVIVQYYHDGKPISEAQNKISSIAWWYTDGIPGAIVDEKGKGHLPAPELRKVLADLGVTDTKTAFSVELPNGVRLSSTLGKLVAPEPKVKGTKDAVKKAAPKKAKAPTLSATKKAKAALVAASKVEGAAIKAWKEAGEVGPKPETPATDELTALLERKPSGGTKKAAQVTGVVPTNVGRGAKKVPATKKAAPKKATIPSAKAAAKKAPAAKKAAPKKAAPSV